MESIIQPIDYNPETDDKGDLDPKRRAGEGVSARIGVAGRESKSWHRRIVEKLKKAAGAAWDSYMGYCFPADLDFGYNGASCRQEESQQRERRHGYEGYRSRSVRHRGGIFELM